mmetsp:Transcript_30445/g.71305  ORF Transcript_30445/g.71305 Transcript_30445/m.71305 type:complete len:813 (-) Transcript_30445:91-2529(-)
MNGTTSDSDSGGESDDESYSFVDQASSSSDDDGDFSISTNGDNNDADDFDEHDASYEYTGGHRRTRATLRQHLPAVAIAIVAAVLGHAHLNDGEFLHVTLTGLYRDFVENHGGGTRSMDVNSIGSKGNKYAAAPTLNVPTPYPTVPMPHLPLIGDAGTDGADRHHHRYRRTANLGFCKEHDEVNNKSNNDDVSKGVRNLLGGSRDDTDENIGTMNPGLVPFDFRIPNDLVSTLGMHYLADEKKEDRYESVLVAVKPTSADREYQCLLDKAAESSPKNHNLKGWGLAYVRPDISTFYRGAGGVSAAVGVDLGTVDVNAVNDKSSDMPSIKSILKSRREEHLQKDPEAAAEAAKREEQAVAAVAAAADSDIGNKRTVATPTCTGFAAKFTNLTPNPLNLYWDGRGGSNARLVGRFPPFESLSTATTPGRSFSVLPATQDGYDDRFVLQRWTMTADEAHVYYDPEEDNFARLTTEQQMRYNMWKLNQAYARDYLIRTRRLWLANFPRPAPFHFMHKAEYFGKTLTFKSWESHFTSRPPRSDLEKLSFDDHEHRVHRETRYGKDLSIALPKYRQDSGRELELKMEAISCAPQVFRIDDFLSKVEVEHIIDLVKDGSRNITLSRSAVHPGGVSGYSSDGDKVGNEQADTTTRSSKNAWIEREATPIVDSIYRRAADLLGIDEALMRHRSDEEHPELATDHSIAERMQLVHYAEGEQYNAHHDFSFPAFGNRHQPSRFATLLLYLNDVEEGGETVFPRAINSESHDGISVKPKAGTAIFFYNVLPDGNLDDLSQHQSAPVRSGEKYLANLWIWDPIID